MAANGFKLFDFF